MPSWDSIIACQMINLALLSFLARSFTTAHFSCHIRVPFPKGSILLASAPVIALCILPEIHFFPIFLLKNELSLQDSAQISSPLWCLSPCLLAKWKAYAPWFVHIWITAFVTQHCPHTFLYLFSPLDGPLGSKGRDLIHLTFPLLKSIYQVGRLDKGFWRGCIH